MKRYLFALGIYIFSTGMALGNNNENAQVLSSLLSSFSLSLSAYPLEEKKSELRSFMQEELQKEEKRLNSVYTEEEKQEHALAMKKLTQLRTSLYTRLLTLWHLEKLENGFVEKNSEKSPLTNVLKGLVQAAHAQANETDEHIKGEQNGKYYHDHPIKWPDSTGAYQNSYHNEMPKLTFLGKDKHHVRICHCDSEPFGRNRRVWLFNECFQEALKYKEEFEKTETK